MLHTSLIKQIKYNFLINIILFELLRFKLFTHEDQKRIASKRVVQMTKQGAFVLNLYLLSHLENLITRESLI
jgi:hypothetical protein